MKTVQSVRGGKCKQVQSFINYIFLNFKGRIDCTYYLNSTQFPQIFTGSIHEKELGTFFTYFENCK